MKSEKRKTKLVYNSLSSLLLQLVTIVCSFILPKLFLVYYSSPVNGLIISITYFIGFISLLDLGIGAVVRSNLYKPLATKDMESVSKILKSSKRFFNKIGILLIIYVVALVFIFPLINSDFDFQFTASLIVILAISLVSEYFFGINYRFLLTADQKQYISNLIQIITLILNTVISVILIINGVSIQIVKLFSAGVLLLRPLLLTIYVKKHYSIDKNVVLTEEPIKQKWNGVANHIAYFITNNTDVLVLTVFATLKSVSVYSIYNLVVAGITKVISAIFAGFQAFFGNMLARKEYKALETRFNQFEWSVHTIVTFFFSATFVLIVPFVTVYTKGITDANYIVPSFGYMLTIAIAVFCLRIPYNTIVGAAGHYKQTQIGAILEAVINIVLSVILVYNFGLVGVAVGTAVAMSFRTVYLAAYLSNNIINYKFTTFLKHVLVDFIIAGAVFLITKQITFNVSNYFDWALMGLVVSGITLGVLILVNFIFYRKKFINSLRKIKLRFSRL